MKLYEERDYEEQATHYLLRELLDAPDDPNNKFAEYQRRNYMFSTNVNAVLPERPNGKRETRTKCFNLLLTPSEHKKMTECSEMLGVSKGSLCRIGLNGIVEQAQKDAAAAAPNKLPVEADPFWRNFGRGPQ